MLSKDTLKTNIKKICTEMNSITENGDKYFCDKFCEAFQDYLAEAIISSTTAGDTGTADGGVYTGSSHGVTEGSNKGIRLKKIPDPTSLELEPPMVYALSIALQTTFAIEGATDKTFALGISNDINTALASASISVTTEGETVIGETTTPASCNGTGLFTGIPLIISSSLITAFENMLSNAKDKTPDYDGNEEFATSLANSIHTYMTNVIPSPCLVLTYASVTPPFACVTPAIVS